MTGRAASPGFEPDLFNTEAYAALHAPHFDGAGLRTTYRRPAYDHPDAVFQAMQVRPGVFASPGRGPYGGFDAAPHLGEAELADFVGQTEAALRHAGARRIEVVLPPFCYAPETGPRLLPVLCHLGYCVTRQELNQAITLEPGGAIGYGTYAARKRLNKAVRAGVQARPLAADEHRAGYEAIQQNRRKKGRALSMSWDEVQTMVAAFPTRMHFFGAEQDGTLLAAAICVAVNARVLYVYAWGEIAGAEALSPVSTLADGLLTFAQRRGFQLLDLGTSSVDGIVNPGLLAFKRSLGATDTLKLWLAKVLA